MPCMSCMRYDDDGQLHAQFDFRRQYIADNITNPLKKSRVFSHESTTLDKRNDINVQVNI